MPKTRSRQPVSWFAKAFYLVVIGGLVVLGVIGLVLPIIPGLVFLKAYRWQYIVSGVQLPRFLEVLGRLITPALAGRINEALAPIVASQAE